jgi:hypothetical protein
MLDNFNTLPHFEYVFYFLFRTYLWMEDGSRWDEPTTLGFDTSKRKVLQHGIRFEDDKRLFRRDVPPGESLESWGEHLKRSWRDICRLYTQSFDDKAKAHAYCQKALLGVALLILDDGERVDHHRVSVAVADKKNPILRFAQPNYDKPLFRIRTEGLNKTACLQAFVPMVSENKPFMSHLQLRLGKPDDSTLPRLALFEPGELASNPVFLVYGFSYDGNIDGWKDSVTRLLIRRSPFNRPPLLSTVFARLIMRQWQFGRIDEAAKQLRSVVQSRMTYYVNYASQYEGAYLRCSGTWMLGEQLQEMQALSNEAVFLVSRIQGAVQTLEINGDNLATRLEQIRQEAEQVNWQLHFHKESSAKPVQWPLSDDETPLLEAFNFNINKLQDHTAYLETQLKYLDGLRDRWRLYLENRRTQLGEYLNTLGTVLIFLLAGTGLVTLNVHKDIFGLSFENQLVYLLLIALLLIPIIWHFGRWLIKLFCCIFHGTWLNTLFCNNPIINWLNSVKFFRWFKKT